MRKVDRNRVAKPMVLFDPEEKGPKELEAARSYIKQAMDAAAAAAEAARDAGEPAPPLKFKAFEFAVYKNDAVKAALQSLFHGKCAYCETFYDNQAPVDVEHYRPKGAVEDSPEHPGYWWLAMNWDNLLPSCIDCNRRRRQKTPVPSVSLAEMQAMATKTASTGKKDAFPVLAAHAMKEDDDLDAEGALLLHPVFDDPDEHLTFFIDFDNPLGLVLPKAENSGAAVLPTIGEAGAIAHAAVTAGLSKKGAVSIQVYGLNRLGLVQERTRVLRHLGFLRSVIAEINDIATNLETLGNDDARAAAKRLDALSERIATEISRMAEPEQPYSAMVQQWIEAYRKELQS